MTSGRRRRFLDLPFVLALRLCLRAAPGWTAVTLAAAVFYGAVPLALFAAVSVFAGEVAADPNGTSLAFWVPLIAGIFFLLQVGSSLDNQLNLALGRRVDAWVQRGVMDAALRPATIGHLETAAFRDAAALSRSWEASAYPPGAAVYSVSAIVGAAVVSGGAMLLLASFSWWLPLVLASGFILMTAWSTRVRDTGAATSSRTSAGLRRADYLRQQAFGSASGREARIFGLGGWFRGRADRDWTDAMADVWRDRSGTRTAALLTIIALIGSHLVALAFIMAAAQRGEVNVTQAALYLQAAGGVANLWLPWQVVVLREATRPLPALERLVREGRGDQPPDGDLAAAAPSHEIAFRDVTFHYPGRPALVFDGLDLDIRAGEALAIVGANGAGKTTLVKLLAGLLDPVAGSITVDDANLRDVRIAWQSHVAAIFQDYVRYPFNAHDNVVLGRPLDDPEAFERAIDRAMAGDIVAGLPSGLDTMLSREFDGTDLSGGQWQRIALARALYAVERGATVLILDEPTAQLDVRAEAALFDRFLELTRGLTTVLISHRFSSVRHADRIVVLDAGRVIEDGTHAELLAAGGRYAEMFMHQARHFESDDDA